MRLVGTGPNFVICVLHVKRVVVVSSGTKDDCIAASAQQGVENEVGQAAAARWLQPSWVERRVATLRDNHQCERYTWIYREALLWVDYFVHCK